MKKLSIAKLVEFRRKSERSKKTFVDNLKSTKIESSPDGGGDYWIASLSAVSNSYKANDLNIIDSKIDELKGKLSDTSHKITKNMYQQNIAILQKYKSMDSKKLRPTGKLLFLKKSTGDSLLTIKGLQVEAKPSQIFIFGKKDEENIGAIWFSAKVNGYKIEEVGMFCEMLNRFLKHNYSKKYHLNPKYCMAIDIFTGTSVNLSQFGGAGGLTELLPITLDEINKLL